MKIKYTVDPDKHWLNRFLRCEIKIYTHSTEEANILEDYIVKNSICEHLGTSSNFAGPRQVTIAKANLDCFKDPGGIKNYNKEHVMINVGEGTGWTQEIKDSYIEIDSSLIINTLK